VCSQCAKDVPWEREKLILGQKTFQKQVFEKFKRAI
jgi:hypothetical protein